MTRRELTRITSLSVTVMLLALPGQALAQESTRSAYSNDDVVEVGGTNGSHGTGGATAAATGSGTGSLGTGDPSDPALPFTGLEVALLGVVGAGLLALGLGMRRFSRSPDTA